MRSEQNARKLIERARNAAPYAVNHALLTGLADALEEALREQPEARGVVDFEAWLDRDWPLWRNNPDNPIIARLRRAWDAALTAAQQPEKRAPVQGYHGGTIPWRVHGLAWEGYHKQFRGQSAERIAERGGFGTCEMDKYLPNWRDMAHAIDHPTAPPSAPVGVEGLAAIFLLARFVDALNVRGDMLTCDHDQLRALDAEARKLISSRSALAQQPAQAAPDFCDGHCTWLDHAPGCPRHEGASAPVGVDMPAIWHRLGWAESAVPDDWRVLAREARESIETLWNTQQPAQVAPGDVASRQAWYLREIERAESYWIETMQDRFDGGDDVPGKDHFVALWLAERTPPGDDAAGGGHGR